MKRYALTACLSIACCLCVFFFSPSVNATGTVNKTSSATIDGPNSNYHASIRATQYQGVATAGNGTSTSAYVGQSAIVVTANFYNEGDDPWYLDGVHVQLHDSSTTSHKLTDFDIIGGNLTVSQINTPYIFTIGGGENNSYNQGFVVAPHSKLSVAFRVSAFATSDSGNSQFSLDHVSTGAVTNTVGDYPYGIDVDFSPLIDYLNSDVVPEMIDQGVTLDDILDNLTFSSLPDLGFGSSSATVRDFRFSTVNSSYPVISVNRSILSPYLSDREFYVDPSLDSTSLSSNVWVVPVHYVISFRTDKRYSYSANYLNFTNSSPFTSWANFVGCDVKASDNDFYFGYSGYSANNLFLYSKQYTEGYPYFLTNSGWSYYDYYVYYYFVSTSNSVFVPSINTTFSCTLSSGSFTPYSTDLESDMNDIHNQEQQYFSDTNSAIGDTGIENYQFDQGTTSGMHGIKDDFTAVWNACGSLTNVWIFSLTFSVALSIIRHVRLKHF